MLQQVEPVERLHAFGPAQHPPQLPEQVWLRYVGSQSQRQAYQ